MAGEDVAHDLFPQARAAVVARVNEILEAMNAQDVDRLDAHHLWGSQVQQV